jgi:hypothetical protein
MRCGEGNGFSQKQNAPFPGRALHHMRCHRPPIGRVGRPVLRATAVTLSPPAFSNAFLFAECARLLIFFLALIRREPMVRSFVVLESGGRRLLFSNADVLCSRR